MHIQIYIYIYTSMHACTYIYIYIYIYYFIQTFYGERAPDFVISCYLVL